MVLAAIDRGRRREKRGLSRMRSGRFDSIVRHDRFMGSIR